ncbi:arginase family protein [Actinoplanes sp. CA-142083]|uniref:arginase family protein n=1 Tax=Actinoplanes sp. CA-142083 TaxID=3239903 RepID=UPI003D8EAF0C
MAARDDEVTLRLVWPQWQGAGTSSVRELASEFPFDAARRGYAVGAAVLAAILPSHDGPVAVAPVAMGDDGLDLRDGIGTPASEYPGFHAMAVAALTGHGDREVLELLPATVDPGRVALAGLHAWAEDDIGNVAEWGIRAFAPDDLRDGTRPLLEWLAATGCTKLAVHFDVDTVDSNEIVLGLGAEPDGLTSAQVRRIVSDLGAAGDVVGLTIAEFFPRQVMHLQRMLAGFPLL